jgi:hypothetical protein
MEIVDCFLFFNEIDMLLFRLKELNDYVDYFVLLGTLWNIVFNIYYNHLLISKKQK